MRILVTEPFPEIILDAGFASLDLSSIFPLSILTGEWECSLMPVDKKGVFSSNVPNGFVLAKFTHLSLFVRGNPEQITRHEVVALGDVEHAGYYAGCYKHASEVVLFVKKISAFDFRTQVLVVRKI